MFKGTGSFHQGCQISGQSCAEYSLIILFVSVGSVMLFPLSFLVLVIHILSLFFGSQPGLRLSYFMNLSNELDFVFVDLL